MTENEFRSLYPGDIIKGVFSKQTYMVTANYGDRVTAVTTVDMTQPSEWTLVLKASHQKPETDETEKQ